MSTVLKKQKENLTITKKQKTYPYDELLKTSVAYFNGDELAATNWMNKNAMNPAYILKKNHIMIQNHATLCSCVRYQGYQT